MDFKQLISELRAEHAKIHRAIEDLERLYGLPASSNRLEVKRLGRPRKKPKLVPDPR